MTRFCQNKFTSIQLLVFGLLSSLFKTSLYILEAKVTTFISRLCCLTAIQTDNYFTASL